MLKIRLVNELQLAFLEKIRERLTTFLRQQTGFKKLRIEPEVEVAEITDKPYTAREKLQYLTDKYEGVKALQEKLGLDPEF